MYKIPSLPLIKDIETKAVLKKVALARTALAELKGASSAIPNEAILLNTLSLQEAKDSSAIENIITTHDELYQSDSTGIKVKNLATKEVKNYANALLNGYKEIKKTGLLTLKSILLIQSTLEENDAGFRKLPGTTLKNDITGEVIYTPPQHFDEIQNLMGNLEIFINDNSVSELDALVKMAIIHHQFESIHPFYDGNGRTGRIINILYLVKEELLTMPILYLSRFINKNKEEYYRLLQAVRDTENWEDWIIFMLTAVEQTSMQTLKIIKSIRQLMLDHKQHIRKHNFKIYSQDLINNIFQHPYTKTEFLMNDLGISRLTATKYLEELCKIDILKKEKIWKENFYVNTSLYNLLSNI